MKSLQVFTRENSVAQITIINNYFFDLWLNSLLQNQNCHWNDLYKIGFQAWLDRPWRELTFVGRVFLTSPEETFKSHPSEVARQCVVRRAVHTHVAVGVDWFLGYPLTQVSQLQLNVSPAPQIALQSSAHLPSLRNHHWNFPCRSGGPTSKTVVLRSSIVTPTSTKMGTGVEGRNACQLLGLTVERESSSCQKPQRLSDGNLAQGH